MGKGKKSTNYYLGLFILIILIGAIGSSIFAGNSVKTMESGSPELVVQNYLQSISGGKYDAAAKHFSKISKCKVEDVDRVYVERNIQVALLSSEIDQNTSTVRIAIERDSSIFSMEMRNEEHIFRLLLENGIWKLTGIPWPLYGCGEFNK